MYHPLNSHAFHQYRLEMARIHAAQARRRAFLQRLTWCSMPLVGGAIVAVLGILFA
jgi:hypothetical protein